MGKWPKKAIKIVKEENDRGVADEFQAFIELYDQFEDQLKECDEDYRTDLATRANGLFEDYDAGDALFGGVESITDLSATLDDDEKTILYKFLVDEGVVETD